MTRYELLDRIGVGGMAEIFRGKAVAAGGFEKPVAIKRILPHLSQDKRFVELLIAEAKVLSLLKHRNIVQIFDVGLGDDGKYFLVMEYVDGKDLGAVQRGLEAHRRRIPFDLALHVVAEICEALEHAHSARAPDGKSMSLVHRDVSPSNVLLSRAGEVKLTDFGIAKRAEQESTGHGAVRGKFAYISPEQARNEHLDPRSDVFSVGILLWELVTSRRLFSGLSDMDALRAVREAQVPRPREVDGRLTAEIDALIMSSLAPEARGRPTAGQLGAKLRTMRYALEVTVGDPATELAKIIDTAEEVERLSSKNAVVRPSSVEFDGSDATVIRIHTADAFSMRDKDGSGVAAAREVIDRFEEEETRQAQLSRDQMAFLRDTAPRDSGELSSPVEPPLPGLRPWHPDDERTRAREPLLPVELAAFPPDGAEPDQPFDGDEATRLLAAPPRRTPVPERVAPERIAVRMTPQPQLLSATPQPRRDPTPPPLYRTPPPGTVHERGGRGMPPSPLTPPPASLSHPPPPTMQLPPQPLVPPPPAPQHQPPAMPPPRPLPPAPLVMHQMPPGNYASWGMPTQPPLEGLTPAPPAFERPVTDRPSVPRLARPRKPRARPLRPWMLVIGALMMALLAFAVTRACIHSATSRPAAEPR